MKNQIDFKKSHYFTPGFLSMKSQQYLITVILMVIFGFGGFLVSLFIPPQYEAVSYLVTNLEVVQDTNVNEIMIDSQLELIGQLLFYPDITDELLSIENEANNPLTLSELKEKSNIERRLMTTLIKVRDEDPEISARIATNWAEIAFRRLNEAYGHAVLVSEAKGMIATIEGCSTELVISDTDYCQQIYSEDVEKLASEAYDIVQKESPNALGLTKELQISQAQPAAVPAKAIQATRANFIFAGALIGLLISLVAYELIFSKTDNEE